MKKKNIFVNMFDAMVEGRERRIRNEIAQYRKALNLSNKDIV
jgi:hypothetical protein